MTPRTTEKVGQVDPYSGHVNQEGDLNAEVIVFPDGSKYDCVYDYNVGLQCFPVKIGAQ